MPVWCDGLWCWTWQDLDRVLYSVFIFNGGPTAVGVKKDENLFVSINQPDFCLIVFSGWRILRNHFREKQITIQGSLLGRDLNQGCEGFEFLSCL